MEASGCEVKLSRNRFIDPEAFVSHATATLTPITRLRLVTDRRTGVAPVRGSEKAHGLPTHGQ